MMQRRTRATGAGGLRAAVLATLAALSMAATSLPAAAEEPLKIGFGMAETGPLAGTGKSALLAMTIWAEDVNAKGGLLGRQVKLIHYDDQSSPANVPALYAKLIDLDKVDLIISGYATPIIASTIPIAMQHDMVLMGFFGLANNAKFKYDKYFGIFPAGEKPALAIMQPFFDAAMTLDPKPTPASPPSSSASPSGSTLIICSSPDTSFCNMSCWRAPGTSWAAIPVT
jgi:branched-chain amino acid transport system substrate-binding protein